MAFNALTALKKHYAGQTSIEDLDKSTYDDFPQFMNRMSEQCPLITPELETMFMKQGAGRSFSIPTLDETPITTTSTETFNIPQNLGVTGEMDLTVVTVFSGFIHYPNTFFNNAVTADSYFMDRITATEQAHVSAFSQACISFLESYKTQTFSTTGYTGFSFNGTSDELEISLAAQQGRMITAMQGLMRSNGKASKSGYSYIANSSFENSVLDYYEAYGANNEKNLQNQMSQSSFFYSDEITPSNKWGGYLLRNGEVGYLQTFEPSFQNGENIGDFKKWDILPIFGDLGMPVGVYYEKGSSDNSGLNTANKMDIAEKWGFVNKFAFVRKRNSDYANNPAGIIKLDGLSS